MRWYLFVAAGFMVHPGYLLSQPVAAAGAGPVLIRDSTFAVLFNSNLSFAGAHDGHINNWLTKYHYRPAPRHPLSLNFELAAIPFHSGTMYSLRASTIVSGQDLSSLNLLAGVHQTILKSSHFRLLAGLEAGYHIDIINLTKDMPPDYKSVAMQLRRQLSLHRTGFIVEPGARAFWYPVQTAKWQVGLFTDLGYDCYFNSRWKLGYYQQDGRFDGFKRIKKPADQTTVVVYGWAYGAGISICLHVK
jgi:hypothetical protein